FFPVFAWGQQSTPTDADKRAPLAENAPQDKPVQFDNEASKKFEEAIAPYVAKARATLPGTRKRFAQGLNKGEVLFVTTRIHDADGKYEQVFVEVKSWKDKTITGLLATNPSLIKGHKLGEKMVVAEEDVYDWTISKPDGTEEGNFVGNFLDTYKP
ncbi:MAG TPA: DUF2314 domain-containing protein, partial [Candidatus Angelobacter sp.]|nr:DUF2314 domain-containing protein [Candidatus Angelobacter sp.]